MDDVRWYYDQPPSKWDVSTFRPMSAPPVYRKGGWNFDVSPTDLFSLGKYAFGGLKDLFSGGLPSFAGLPAAAGAIGPEAAAMATPGVAPSSLDSMLAATGYSPTAVAPGATAAALSELYPTAGGIGAGVTGAGSLSMLGAPTAGMTGGIGTGVTGAGTLDLGGLAAASPLLYAAAVPAALYAMKAFLGKSHDPMAAIQSQFGTESPPPSQVADYFANPDSRRVSVMDTLEGLSKLGYNVRHFLLLLMLECGMRLRAVGVINLCHGLLLGVE